MFDHLGWSELVVLAVIGLVVFGPERLPKAAADVARMLRQLRMMARSASADLRAELGPEMADIDLRSLHPRTLVRDALRDDDDVPRRGPVLAPGETPPYDADAT